MIQVKDITGQITGTGHRGESTNQFVVIPILVIVDSASQHQVVLIVTTLTSPCSPICFVFKPQVNDELFVGVHGAYNSTIEMCSTIGELVKVTAVSIKYEVCTGSRRKCRQPYGPVSAGTKCSCSDTLAFSFTGIALPVFDRSFAAACVNSNCSLECWTLFQTLNSDFAVETDDCRSLRVLCHNDLSAYFHDVTQADNPRA